MGRLGVAVVIQGPEGEILQANPAAEILLGVPAPWRFVALDRDFQPTDEPVDPAAVVRGERGRLVRAVASVRPDGSKRPLRVTCDPLHTEADGAVTETVAVFTDLAPAAERVRSIRRMLDQLPDGFGLLRPGLREDGEPDVDLPVEVLELSARARDQRGVFVALSRTAELRLKLRELVCEAYRSGQLLTFELDRLDDDGVFLACRAVRVDLPDGPAVLFTSREAADQVRIERDLIESRRRADEVARTLDSILQAATATAIVALDLSGRIRSFNHGAELMFGYRSDEVVGRSPAELWLDPAELQAYAREVGVEPSGLFAAVTPKKGMSTSRIWTFHKTDGSLGKLDVQISPMVDDQGEITGYTSVTSDVTEQFAVRERLEAEAERWKTLLDALPDTAVFEVVERADGRLQFASRRGLRGEDSPYPDIVGIDVLSTIEALLIEGEAPKLLDAYSEALAGHTRQLTVAYRDGSYIDLAIVPLQRQEGLRRLMVVWRDVTEARKREQALAHAEERFRRMFSDAPTGVLVHTTGGLIKAANRALCQILRVESEHDVVGLTVSELARSVGLRPSDWYEIYNKAVNEGSNAGEMHLQWPDGRTADLLFDSVGLLDGNGEIEEVLVNFVDISARRQVEAQLAYLADHDPLTDLFNRRRFEQELDLHLLRGERYGHRGAVILLDLDRFKQINDSFGHAVGDQVLISASAVLRSQLRESDVVARLGGDEFAVLLPSGDVRGAEAIAAKLVKAIRTEVRVRGGGDSPAVSASVGVVPVDQAGMTREELMRRVDMAMYDAKDAGRDRHATFDADSVGESSTDARAALSARIERALAEGRFVLLAQPVLRVATGVIVGAELLVRMRNDVGEELLDPSDFLAVAERVGSIRRIDEWVVAQAVAVARQAQLLRPDFRIEINVSGRSMNNPALLAPLRAAGGSAGGAPSGLVVQVTEAAAARDLDATRAFAAELSALGCCFALDDFGEGAASFYQLKHLAVDLVKVDGEFIQRCAEPGADRLIVAAIADLCRGLGIETTAESVENAATLEAVTELGVTFAQGFAVARPVAVSDLLAELGSPAG